MANLAPAAANSRRIRWRRRWTVLLVFIAAGLAPLTYVAAANFVLVDLRLPWWQDDVRLSWVVLGCSATGFVAGFVTARLLR